MTGPYFRRLAACLMRRGLPAVEARRLTAELEDHAVAAADDHRGGARARSLARRRVLRRFGDPDSFADSLIGAYRDNSFLWRHPVLGFGLGPLLLLVAVFTTPMILGHLVHFDDGVSRILWMELSLGRGEILGICNAFGAVLNAVCTGIAGLAVYRMGSRAMCAERNVAWSFAILALLGCLTSIRFDLIPPLSPGQAFSFAYSIGLGFPPKSAFISLIAFLSPVTLFLLYHRRMTRTAPP